MGIIIHGLAKHPLYKRWKGIKNRCYNRNEPAYPRYGGRGIKMGDDWLKDFMNFYRWAIDNGYKKGLHIDRINNDGHYEASNCRWVTPMVNNENTRTNKRFEFRGQLLLMKEIAKLCGINYPALYNRIHIQKLSMEDAVKWTKFSRKVSQEQVEAIFKSDLSYDELAKKYGFNKVYIMQIKTGIRLTRITSALK